MDTVKINSKKTKIIAHRGLSGLECENTCAAFIAAANRSYFGIEADIHKTADSQFAVIHDETTARITLGKSDINVEKSDYTDIQSIILPDTDKSTIRKDLRIPLLSEYISICKKYSKTCVLEIKNPFSFKSIKAVIDEIKDSDYLKSVIFISFVLENCIRLRRLLPDGDIQWLLAAPVTEEIIKTLKKHKLDLASHYGFLNAKVVKNLHSNGIKVNAWTCDDKRTAQKLIVMGVDFITTNILE